MFWVIVCTGLEVLVLQRMIRFIIAFGDSHNLQRVIHYLHQLYDRFDQLLNIQSKHQQMLFIEEYEFLEYGVVVATYLRNEDALTAWKQRKQQLEKSMLKPNAYIDTLKPLSPSVPTQRVELSKHVYQVRCIRYQRTVTPFLHDFVAYTASTTSKTNDPPNDDTITHARNMVLNIVADWNLKRSIKIKSLVRKYLQVVKCDSCGISKSEVIKNGGKMLKCNRRLCNPIKYYCSKICAYTAFINGTHETCVKRHMKHGSV